MSKTLADLMDEAGAPKTIIPAENVTEIHAPYYPAWVDGALCLLCRVSGTDSEGRRVHFGGAWLPIPYIENGEIKR